MSGIGGMGEGADISICGHMIGMMHPLGASSPCLAWGVVLGVSNGVSWFKQQPAHVVTSSTTCIYLYASMLAGRKTEGRSGWWAGICGHVQPAIGFLPQVLVDCEGIDAFGECLHASRLQPATPLQPCTIFMVGTLLHYIEQW